MCRTDPEVGVRANALAVYAGAAGARALATLEEATSPDLPLNIRSTAVRMLGRLRDPSTADVLARLTDPVEPRGLRQSALSTLAAIGDEARTVQVAGDALSDYDPLYATSAVSVLSRLGTPAARARLEAAAKTETRVHVKEAIERALARGR